MSAAADFADRFAAYWRAPTVEGLDALLAPDVRLVAPMTRASVGLEEGKRVFGSLLRLLPDLTGVVHRWGPTPDGLLIEFTLSATAGGTTVSWDAVDRIVLREDGLATLRVSYFDSGRLLRQVALRPRAWPTLLRLAANGR
ncbi:MAG TPA: nuclear transport factor 2 family protein [Solirubrobacterales bacterium]|nr:nuclear transport factor 2 family protein [Solirubrobacterales bacterium]